MTTWKGCQKGRGGRGGATGNFRGGSQSGISSIWSGGANYNHRFNMRLEHTIDENRSLIFTPRINVQRTHSDRAMEANTLDENRQPVNELTSINQSENLGYDLRGNLLYRHRFKTEERTFSANLRTSVNDQTGERFDHSMGIPGVFYSHNLTPANLGEWSDGEIFHMITTGINKEGKATFPVMPYPNYGKLDPEDIEAVIAYLWTLEPVENERMTSKADFPINLLMNTFPQKPSFQPRPPKSDRVAYGRYMITASACNDCHTRREGPDFVGEPYAGGQEFLFPDGSIVRSANLTPHETGIGNWTRETFINRFRAYNPAIYEPHEVQPGEFQTIMPWMMYAEMTEEDLGAIYDYLQKIAPVDNTVRTFTAAEE